MQIVSIEWDLRGSSLLRSVQITGTVMGNIHNKITSRVLLNETLNRISLAEKNRGVLIPLSKPPIKNNKEFSYFEVIFKNNEDFNEFVTLFNNRSS